MTIEDIDTIDSIGLDKKTGDVTLKIFDHLDWKNEVNHLQLLQSKLNTYLRFLESGEVYNAYKFAQGKNFLISIDFLVTPPANGIRFLDTAAHILADAGFEIEYSIDKVK
jgi:Family of unknown function (DUF6572)